jgi:glycosyltransferase involved in cell wall biosynthesis
MMAHLFKKKSKDNKGIIIFTHKEWPWLLSGHQETLKKLKKDYFLGWHQGGQGGAIGPNPNIDFFMTTDKIGKVPNSEFKIPYMSRNFLSEEYENLIIEDRYFDIICVNRVYKIKMTVPLLKAIRKLFDKGKKYKCLLVLPTAENENSSSYDTNIVKLYNSMFSYEEKKYVTLVRTSKEIGFLGISSQTLNWFYNNSKCLYVGSTNEGGCKVASEGALSGCNLVYYKKTNSGIPDNVHGGNGFPFDGYDSIDVSLEKAVENFKLNKESISYFEDLLSVRTVNKKLKPYFDKLYTDNGMVYDGNLINLDNLSRRLPAHYLDVKWDNPKTPTADIKNNEQLKIFIDYINE